MRIFAAKELSESNQHDIWELLKAADKEFIPPLSARNSTRQNRLKPAADEVQSEPWSYYEQLMEQCFILAEEENKVVGFFSYIPEYAVRYPVKGETVTADYISTIIVNPQFRNRRLTRSMYELFLAMPGAELVATRTWSQNHAHIHILESLGFTLAERIPDDRGEGIDTVYYQRKR